MEKDEILHALMALTAAVKELTEAQNEMVAALMTYMKYQGIPAEED